MKWFIKYGFVVLLFNTIFYSIVETKDFFAPIVFYSIMILGSIIIFFNPSQTRNIIFHKAFLFLLIINIINIIYFLFIDDITNQESLEFLLARFVQFLLISSAVFYNYDYFKYQFQKHIIILISTIIILSIILDPYIFSSRYHGIIWNPNMLASITVIAFSFLLFKKEKKTTYELFALFIFLLIIIASGSRSALIGIALAFLFNYGLSLRTIIYSIIGFVVLILISTTNLDTSLNRMISQNLLNDRIEQFSFALDNIQNELFFGYGLDQYSGLPDDIDIPKEYKGNLMGSHNGYLAILLQYGIIFGLIVFFIIFQKSINLIQFSYHDRLIAYKFIIVYTLLAGFFECYFTGINEFQTILFWFSLSLLSYSKSIQEDAV